MLCPLAREPVLIQREELRVCKVPINERHSELIVRPLVRLDIDPQLRTQPSVVDDLGIANFYQLGDEVSQTDTLLNAPESPMFPLPIDLRFPNTAPTLWPHTFTQGIAHLTESYRKHWIEAARLMI